MFNGLLVVDKEQNYTSMDVVALIRGMSGQKKVGHTGTLDPGATGVLPICLGNATKLCDILTEKTKEYEAVCRLGITTDTEDIWGKELSSVCVSEEAFSNEKIREAVLSFEGDYGQIPPMYSAVWKDGKRLYDLARKGIEVDRDPRRVQIHKMEILSIDLPEVRFRVSCSKGTYIRTLCADIGKRLGCGGAMAELRRIRSGVFDLSQARTLSQIQVYKDEGRFGELVIPTDACFPDLPKLTVTKAGNKGLYNGNYLFAGDLADPASDTETQDRFRIYDSNGIFYGIYERKKEAQEVCLKPWKMFPPVN